MRLLSPDKTGGINPGAIICLPVSPRPRSSTPEARLRTSGASTSVRSRPASRRRNARPRAAAASHGWGRTPATTRSRRRTWPGYAFASGNGTNCTFNGSTATASVIAAAGGRRMPAVRSTTPKETEKKKKLIVKGKGRPGPQPGGKSEDTPPKYPHPVPEGEKGEGGGGEKNLHDHQRRRGAEADRDQGRGHRRRRHRRWPVTGTMHIKQGAAADVNGSLCGSESPGTTKTLSDRRLQRQRDRRPERLHGHHLRRLRRTATSAWHGEKKTCTITNDDVAPKLTVNKVVTTTRRHRHGPDWAMHVKRAIRSPTSPAARRRQSNGATKTLEAPATTRSARPTARAATPNRSAAPATRAATSRSRSART